VLRVTGEQELRQITAAARAAGLAEIRDAGWAHLMAGTPTCCAIGPAEAARVDALTVGLSLL
jgi:PTH2 family peptidyl-tRNA hydrolase